MGMYSPNPTSLEAGCLNPIAQNDHIHLVHNLDGAIGKVRKAGFVPLEGKKRSIHQSVQNNLPSHWENPDPKRLKDLSALLHANERQSKTYLHEESVHCNWK